MFEQDQITYTYLNSLSSSYKQDSYNTKSGEDSIARVKSTVQTIPFDEYMKFRMNNHLPYRRRPQTNEVMRRKTFNVPDEALLYLTEKQNLLDNDAVKQSYEKTLNEKKFLESKAHLKSKYDGVKTKLYENRNPNVRNLLKDIIKPTEASVKKLQNELKSEFDEFMSQHVASSKLSRKTARTTKSRKSSQLLKTGEEKHDEGSDSAEPHEESRLMKNKSETWNFMTESKEMINDKQDEKKEDEESAGNGFDEDEFKKKYKYLLKNDSDSDSDESDDENKDKSDKKKENERKKSSKSVKSEKSVKSSLANSTAELMRDEVTTTKKSSKSTLSESHQDTKSRTETKSKSKTESTTAIVSLPPIEVSVAEPEVKVTDNKQLVLYNRFESSPSALIKLTESYDDLKKIYKPQFQNELHHICQHGRDANLVNLVSESFELDVNQKENGLGRYCIHECCINNNVEMLKGILPYVEDINKIDKNEQTASHICAKYGSLDCLRFLAANGANLLLHDKHGLQLSHLAAQNNHANILKFLFEIGISLKSPCNEGKVPLHYAAQYGSLESLKLLTQYYVDVSPLDNNGNYAAHLACMNDKLKCLKHLIKLGTPINTSRNKMGRNFAHVCCVYNAVNCLHWLLENGADKKARDDEGNTLTHLACLGGSAECLNCCLQHDIDLNSYNYKSERPFNVARRVGRSLHMKKAVQNEIKCPNCVKVAVKYKWDLEHEKTLAEITIAKNKSNYYNLGELHAPIPKPVTKNVRRARDLIAQYFGPDLDNN